MRSSVRWTSAGRFRDRKAMAVGSESVRGQAVGEGDSSGRNWQFETGTRSLHISVQTRRRSARQIRATEADPGAPQCLTTIPGFE